MGSESKTCWNKAFYDPRPKVKVAATAPSPKLSKTRMKGDPDVCQKVYSAILSGCQGTKEIREKLGLTIWHAAEAQRQLAKAGYLVMSGPNGNRRYAAAKPSIKEVIL